MNRFGIECSPFVGFPGEDKSDSRLNMSVRLTTTNEQLSNNLPFWNSLHISHIAINRYDQEGSFQLEIEKIIAHCVLGPCERTFDYGSAYFAPTVDSIAIAMTVTFAINGIDYQQELQIIQHRSIGKKRIVGGPFLD